MVCRPGVTECWDRGDERRVELLDCDNEVTLKQAARRHGVIRGDEVIDKSLIIRMHTLYRIHRKRSFERSESERDKLRMSVAIPVWMLNGTMTSVGKFK